MTLAQERNEVAQEIRRLANLANDPDHDWTDDDERAWRRADTRITEIDTDYRETRNIGLEDRTGDRSGGPITTATNSGPAEHYRDTRTGRAVPVFRSGDSMADHVRATRGDDGYDGFTAGDAVRALVTGGETELERRALSEGSDGAGGFSVPSVLSAQLIDLMRARSTVFQAGAGTIPVQSDQHSFAKLASDATPAWRAELGSVGTGDPTFESVTFAPKSLAVLVRVSEELLQDSVNIGMALNRSMAEALALEVDRVALLGSGSSNEPTGLSDMSNVQEISMGTNGAAISDYTPILDAIEDLQEANAGETTAAIMAPRTLRVFNGLTDTTGQPLRRPVSLDGLPFLESTQVPIDQTQGTESDASSIYLGNFRELIIGMRQNLRIEVLKERYRDNLEIGFLAHMRLDVQAWHEESLAKIIGVIPA